MSDTVKETRSVHFNAIIFIRAMSSHRLYGLPPAVNRQTRVLILGSFPGTASLAAGQYYAHPRNQFWALLSALLEEDLTKMPYPQRLKRLNAHGIGVWDVIGSCERSGSLDAAIRKARLNDFSALKKHCPHLEHLCFNGKTAGRHAPHFAREGFVTAILPSSSPANAQLSFAQKLISWRAMLHAGLNR